MGEACEWFNDGCVIGCDACSNSGEYYCNEPMPNGEKSSCYPPASQNGCTVDGKLSDEPPMPAESLPHEFRTWDMNGHSPSWGVTGKSMTANHPWRAPGHSPISNPCGIASGTVPGLPGGGDGHGKPPAVPTGYKRAMNGTDLPELEGGPTSWSESSNGCVQICTRVSCHQRSSDADRCCQQRPAPHRRLPGRCLRTTAAVTSTASARSRR